MATPIVVDALTDCFATRALVVVLQQLRRWRGLRRIALKTVAVLPSIHSLHALEKIRRRSVGGK
jgi:hypothetical protein